tara:strand:- start:175 stop:582 length:408 start_codon:yes stop_codon:yes gene_type:complete
MPHKNLVWVNGVFDVLHMGHIKLLQRARQMGLPVVVGIDTDERVKAMKGASRPINSLQDRRGVLQAIKYVDEVREFSTDDELKKHLKELSPRYMLIGEEYRGKVIIGKEFIKEVIYMKRYGELSSSNIINGTHTS